MLFLIIVLDYIRNRVLSLLQIYYVFFRSFIFVFLCPLFISLFLSYRMDLGWYSFQSYLQ